MDILTEISITSSDESYNKEKRFVCSFDGCFKEFTKNRKLINHLRLHTGERPFACDVPSCSKKYTNSSHLRRHKKVKHEHSEQIICTADGCGRELTNKYSLKKHMYLCHNPQKIYSFTCVECQQGFYRKKHLQQHSYLHTGELPFSCDQCNAKFTTTKERKKHKRIHRKYTCECGDVCEKWTALLAHKKTCKLRSLKCCICDKTFSNRTNLKIHSSTHLDKEDRDIYMCPYDECGRYYFYKTNLRVHIKSYHEKVSRAKIPCTYEGCNKLSDRMQTHNIHLKTHKEINKIKRPRKPRKDKGIPKKKMVEKLFGVTLLDLRKIEENEQLNNKVISKSGDNSENINEATDMKSHESISSAIQLTK